MRGFAPITFALLACGNAGSPLLIQGVSVPTAAAGVCSAGLAQTASLDIDLKVDTGILTPAVVGSMLLANNTPPTNALTPQPDPFLKRTNTSDIQLTSAAIELFDDTGASQGKVNEPVTLNISAGGSGSIVMAVVPDLTKYFAEVYAGLLDTKLKRFVARVQFSGHYTSGASIKSNTFDVPVGMCNGCAKCPKGTSAAPVVCGTSAINVTCS